MEGTIFFGSGDFNKLRVYWVHRQNWLYSHIGWMKWALWMLIFIWRYFELWHIYFRVLAGIWNFVDILFGAFGELELERFLLVGEENWLCYLFSVTGFGKFEFNIELVEFAKTFFLLLSFCWFLWNGEKLS